MSLNSTPEQKSLVFFPYVKEKEKRAEKETGNFWRASDRRWSHQTCHLPSSLSSPAFWFGAHGTLIPVLRPILACSPASIKSKRPRSAIYLRWVDDVWPSRHNARRDSQTVHRRQKVPVLADGRSAESPSRYESYRKINKVKVVMNLSQLGLSWRVEGMRRACFVPCSLVMIRMGWVVEGHLALSFHMSTSGKDPGINTTFTTINGRGHCCRDTTAAVRTRSYAPWTG